MKIKLGTIRNATRAPSWKDYLQGNLLTHTVTQQHEHLNKNQNNKSWDYTYKVMEVIVCQLK